MKYLYPKQLMYLHQQLIRTSGGSAGIRDEGLLESAAYRPQGTFGGQELYPDLFTKAAALGHSIINNHPFVDGNKRVGFAAMRIMLRLNGKDMKASDDEKYDFVIEIAKGNFSEQAIADWLEKHSIAYEMNNKQREKKFRSALQKVNKHHSKTFKRLGK